MIMNTILNTMLAKNTLFFGTPHGIINAMRQGDPAARAAPLNQRCVKGLSL